MPAPPPEAKIVRELSPPKGPDGPVLPYAELDVVSNFSFLRGASHPDELVFRAAELGYRAIAIADVNTLAGVVRAHEAAKRAKVKLIVGSRLRFRDGSPDVVVWCPDRRAYATLCRLLTKGKRRAPKGECWLDLNDLLEDTGGLWAGVDLDARCTEREPSDDLLALPKPTHHGGSGASCPSPSLPLLHDAFGARLSILACADYGYDDTSRLARLAAISRESRVPLLASNHVHYHDPARRPLQDVLTCVREKCTIHTAGYRLFANAERHLKPPDVLHRLFHHSPRAVLRALEVAHACTFTLDELRYEYPDEISPPGMDRAQYLRHLTEEGAVQRYPAGIPDKVRTLIEHELRLIRQLNIEPYFLTVFDLVRFARSRGILCQGRGSAANSAVCYCIGITSVDPAQVDLLFERFVSAARDEPPDIDVDFEHERREEVLQYAYQKYGRDRCAMTAEVHTYRGRSAVRDVGKALGLGLDAVDRLAKRLDGWHGGVLSKDQVRDAGLDPDSPVIRQLAALTTDLLGFPRHLSQHVGGLVMTRSPLEEMCPIENAAMQDRTVLEWDKDDIDAVGMLKVDCLALGMLTAISKALSFLNEERPTESPPCGGGVSPPLAPKERDAAAIAASDRPVGPSGGETPPPQAVLDRASADFPPDRTFELHTIPWADEPTYDMICRADTVGVFQIESRAQMSMLPRLRPRCFYDLVIEVAIVRPGPIQGNMVHPYLRRRTGLEPVTYPSDALRDVLHKTLGVPLFQEQAMKVAMVAAGFSAEEADRLRRSMAAWRYNGAIETFRPRIIEGMLANGYTREFAEQTFEQIKGFGEYGFPESHAASFALLVYASAWIKRHHPAAFCAAILNSLPMGFYAPAQLVRDAREHGVEVRPADVNFSTWDCSLEVGNDRKAAGRDPSTWGHGGPAVRLGFRMIRGLHREHIDRLVEARRRVGRFESVDYLHRATDLPRHVISQLAEADTFQSLALSRRPATWEALAAHSLTPLETLKAAESDEETEGQRDKGEKLRVSEPACGLLPRPSMTPQERAEGVLMLPRKQPASGLANAAPSPSVPPSNPPPLLPEMPFGQEILLDYATAGLSLKAHPLSLLRDALAAERVVTARHATSLRHGSRVRVAGLVLIRQRPGTASGIVFITLEDETGIANLIVRPPVWERYRSAARHAGVLLAHGTVERGDGGVVHLMCSKLEDRSPLLDGYRLSSRDFH